MEEAGRRQAADTAAALARVARRSALLDHAHDAARDGDDRRAAELVEQAQQLDSTRREQLDERLTSFREQRHHRPCDAAAVAAPAEPTAARCSSPVTLSRRRRADRCRATDCGRVHRGGASTRRWSRHAAVPGLPVMVLASNRPMRVRV